MDVTSTYKFARISARKARDVAREIQGLPVSEALDILNFTPRKGAELFSKAMKAALADAENNFELAVDGLFVKSAIVGEGPTFKRFKPRARGSAAAIRKQTAHITVVLSDDSVESEKKVRVHTSAPKEVAKKEKAASSRAKVDEAAVVDYDSAPVEGDDLKKITGVGPKLAEKLNAAGVSTFDQIANWSEEDFKAVDEQVSFKGIEFDALVAEAKALQEENGK
tara:strand:- start:136 stop:804 length:669 start_codon:yes stop_codon:yes gene_type:complete